ncbi:NAD-dependent protein deacetylase of SIR2 family [Kutzneria buriramensis]|uniref:NAD-dependent SIR2 family protein deacetylase n=1 Tax=Kutzneria buriramensis TaxID=1045776 RepID=A0A3E0HGR3_9PSEU|nr:NAD-dependent protein deacetylase of SIR2 family [Kutzneria buriramensis]REH44546.1 NAD-dependent SIR2 family protein deacetylase [Kutzneria buriramensis]
MDPLIDTCRRWLDEAEHVLVAAGAGLSAAAGYDYGDAARFAELFPALHKAGLRARYQLIGLPLPQPLLWGYWSVHVDDIRFGPGANPVYQQLREIVGGRDHFVMTSNVDGLFERNGFSRERIWTPQGDYARYQCELPCTRQTWASRPIVEAALATYDPESGTVTSPPTCPNCGGRVFLNVRKGPEFIEDPYVATGRRLAKWLEDRAASGGLVVLEIGAGLSTPTVIRRPAEAIVRGTSGARLIRVNQGHPRIPGDLSDRALSVPYDAATLLARCGKAAR